MSGKTINSEQVKVYMQTRNDGKKQVTAAAKAGMSERSGRRIEKGELQPGGKQQRHWRTRVDNHLKGTSLKLGFSFDIINSDYSQEKTNST